MSGLEIVLFIALGAAYLLHDYNTAQLDKRYRMLHAKQNETIETLNKLITVVQNIEKDIYVLVDEDGNVIEENSKDE